MKYATTFLLRTALLVLFLGTVATPARADWLLTPYLGVVFGGAANQFVLNDLDDEFEQRVSFGGSFAYMSKGIFGLEVDYSVAPNFFQFTGGTNNFDILDLDSSVQTLMANVIIAIPDRRLERPRLPALCDGRRRDASAPSCAARATSSTTSTATTPATTSGAAPMCSSPIISACAPTCATSASSSRWTTRIRLRTTRSSTRKSPPTSSTSGEAAIGITFRFGG